MTRAQRMLAGLGAAAFMLAALLVAQKFGWGDGYGLEPLGSVPRERIALKAGERRTSVLAPFSQYAELLQRPLFNEDRKPTPVEEEVSETPAATVAVLDAQLTGVILMPKVKLAMIRENASGKGLRVRLGSELDGTLSGWRLVELEPRKAVFEAQGQQQQVLELAVDKAGAPAAAPPGAPAPPGMSNPVAAQSMPQRPDGLATPQGNMPRPEQSAAAQAMGGNSKAVEPADGSAVQAEQPEVAESIRKRIEERRRQLREEAARLMQQQPQK